MNYLIKNYKGKYRLKAPYDLKTNMFPRELNGQFADGDVYIDCYNKIQIFHYGHSILEVYIPSIGRGRNIIKAIMNEFGSEIILYKEETDSEVSFRFNAKYMNQLEKYLKPKTNGADISPFSTKNLPKSKYKIPDKDLEDYKKIIKNVNQNELITIVHNTNNFLKSLATKRDTWENIKSDMALKGIKGKEYIHSIGKWNEYISYLATELQKE